MARHAVELVGLRAEVGALRSDAAAGMAAVVRDVVRDELGQHTLHSPPYSAPGSSSQAQICPQLFPQASPPDRATLAPRRTASSRTLVGPGPSQEAQQPASVQLQLPSDHPTSSRGPMAVHAQWQAWMPHIMPDLSSESMAMMDELSQQVPGAEAAEWGPAWNRPGAQVAHSVAAEVCPASTSDRSQLDNPTPAGLAVEQDDLLPSSLIPGPAASPALPSSTAVPQPVPVEAAVATGPDQSSSPKRKPKQRRGGLQSPIAGIPTMDLEPSHLAPAPGQAAPRAQCVSLSSPPARQPLAQLSQAPAPSTTSHQIHKRRITMLSPNSDDESLQEHTLAPVARKIRGPKASAAAAKAKSAAAARPLSPAASVASVLSVATTRDGEEGDGLGMSKIARRTYKGKKRVIRTIPQSDNDDDEDDNQEVVNVGRF